MSNRNNPFGIKSTDTHGAQLIKLIVATRGIVNLNVRSHLIQAMVNAIAIEGFDVAIVFLKEDGSKSDYYIHYNPIQGKWYAVVPKKDHEINHNWVSTDKVCEYFGAYPVPAIKLNYSHH